MDDVSQLPALDNQKALLLQAVAFSLFFISLIVVLGTPICKNDSLALNREKQLRVLAHFCRHLAQQAIEALKAALCSREDEPSPKERSLMEGLGAISHVLCVVVAGRTELFITLPQQLLGSTTSPRLIRQQSHLSPARENVQSSQRDSTRRSSRAESFQSPTTSGFPAANVATGMGAIRPQDGSQSFLQEARSEVVISSSPRSLQAHAQRKTVASFPRRETTDEIKHLHFDLDSRLRSVSSSLHIDLEGGGKKAVLLSSQRHRQLLRG